MTQRPVIAGFHPDPSVCRVGDHYYLAVSTFEYAPGVALFRSTDLDEWEQIGNVLHQPSQLDVTGAGPSGGIFAPTLRYHDGFFWMITTNLFDEGGQVIVRAEHPEGPWSEPVRIPSLLAIDPDLVWDEDGTCYLTCAAFGQGIVQHVVDPMTGELLSEARPLWSGTGGKFPEGPHLYRIGDWWYLLIAEGGTESGHAVTIARGPAPTGPFEGNPANPILTHRGLDEPVQNTGHADLVERPDGGWSIVYHGTRPRGASPRWHVLGRETFADDVEWVDGWPVLTDHREPPAALTSTVEELSTDSIPMNWVSPYRFPAEVMTLSAAGWVVAPTDDAPVFVGRRQQHLHMRAVAELEVVDRGGISIRIDPGHSLDIVLTHNTITAVARIGGLEFPFPSRSATGSATVEIRALPALGDAWSSSRGPDLLVAGVVENGAFVTLGQLDGRYLSTEVAGGMTGRVVGVLGIRGGVVVKSFVYEGSDDPALLLDRH